MSKSSWDHNFEYSEEESFKLIPGKKHIRKMKDLRGKSDEEISHTNKKKKCEFYNRGACIKGSQCPFSHSFIPDVAKKICKEIIKGACPKGDSCHYSHNTKRYPCKMLHINQSCLLNDQCSFSHSEIDLEFEEEFLMDNEELLISAFKSNKNLPHVLLSVSEKYSLFVKNHDLLNENRKKEVEPLEPAVNLSFIFGLHTYQTVSREEKARGHTKYKKHSDEKEISTNEPFMIRLVTKNREFIPEKLENIENDHEYNPCSEINAGSVKSLSEFEKNELEVRGSYKIYQGIQLTPESKSSGFGSENEMCSHN